MDDNPMQNDLAEAPAETISPEQVVELLALIGGAIIRSGLRGSDIQVLINNATDLSSDLETVLGRFVTEHRVGIEQRWQVEIDLETSLSDLCDACNLVRRGPIPQTAITDPKTAPSSGYFTAVFPSFLGLYDFSRQLEDQGFRAATLREVLSLLRQNPGLLVRYPHMVILGSRGRSPSFLPSVDTANGTSTLRFRRSAEPFRTGHYRTVVALQDR